MSSATTESADFDLQWLAHARDAGQSGDVIQSNPSSSANADVPNLHTRIAGLEEKVDQLCAQMEALQSKLNESVAATSDENGKLNIVSFTKLEIDECFGLLLFV